jgi:hypothetical protein
LPVQGETILRVNFDSRGKSSGVQELRFIAVLPGGAIIPINESLAIEVDDSMTVRMPSIPFDPIFAGEAVSVRISLPETIAKEDITFWSENNAITGRVESLSIASADDTKVAMADLILEPNAESNTYIAKMGRHLPLGLLVRNLKQDRERFFPMMLKNSTSDAGNGVISPSTSEAFLGIVKPDRPVHISVSSLEACRVDPASQLVDIQLPPFCKYLNDLPSSIEDGAVDIELTIDSEEIGEFGTFQMVLVIECSGGVHTQPVNCVYVSGKQERNSYGRKQSRARPDGAT